MWFKFVDTGGDTIKIEDVPSNAQALKVAEELSAMYGKVEVWTPAFVVAPEIKYKCIDYSKSRELRYEV